MITDLGEDVEHAAGAILRARIGLPLRRISPVGAPVDGIGTLEGESASAGPGAGMP
ncbi:MAG TPA: hypothetical protein VE091_15955 [Gemmatimonadales bacterium]|nr:hypothetical protein [Gemmatimonadales bacterium]